MDVLPFECIDGLKKYWRRKKYQRLGDSVRMRRKLKIARLGRKNSNKNTSHSQMGMKTEKLIHGFKFMFAPVKFLSRLHGAYVDSVVRLAGSRRIDHVENEAKRVAKCRPIPMLSGSRNEMVDSRAVVEMYKRVVSTRDQNSPFLREVY